MSALVNILPHYTYDDYCKWEGRWEIINGIPYAMSPAPSMRHQYISGNIIGEFRESLKTSVCAGICKVFNFIDIKITDDTVVQPDVSVVCGKTKDAFLDFPPEIVVEILSPSTRIKDRTAKFDWYQKFGISYFMIVDPKSEKVEIYHLADGKNYKLIKTDPAQSITFHIQHHCDISLSLPNIWE